MMRRILVDAARVKGSRKPGSRAIRMNFDETAVLAPEPDRPVIVLDEGLGTSPEIAEALKISPRTVRHDWEFAGLFLAREMDHPPGRWG
jgi:hypothetical protein